MTSLPPLHAYEEKPKKIDEVNEILTDIMEPKEVEGGGSGTGRLGMSRNGSESGSGTARIYKRFTKPQQHVI